MPAQISHHNRKGAKMMSPADTPRMEISQGVLRITASKDRTFAQTVLIRYGLSNRQLVIELRGGATLDGYYSYVKRSSIKRVALVGFHPNDRVENSTSLSTSIRSIRAGQTHRPGQDPNATWITPR